MSICQQANDPSPKLAPSTEPTMPSPQKEIIMQTRRRYESFVFESEYSDLQQVPFDIRTDLPLLSYFDTATVAIGVKPRRSLGTEIVCACTEHTTPQIGLLHQTEDDVSFQVSTGTTYVSDENTNVMVIGAVIGLRMYRDKSSTN